MAHEKHEVHLKEAERRKLIGIVSKGRNKAMVTQQISERAAGAHGDTLCTREIIFRDGGAGHFVMCANEGSRCPIDGGFHSAPIPIIDKGSSKRGAGHGR